LAASLFTWFICACGLSLLPTTPASAAAAALAAVCFGQSFLPRSSVVTADAPLTRTDLIGRMLAGAALTILVTTLSARVGAAWSGLLAVFPLLAIVLSVSSHRTHGPDFVISLLRGMVLGRFSFAAFCLLLSFALPHQPAFAAFAEGGAVAMLVQWCTKKMVMRQRVGVARKSAIAAE
jgi:hypothetical protein